MKYERSSVYDPQDKKKSKTSSGAQVSEINERHYKQTMNNDDIFNCADYEREVDHPKNTSLTPMT